MNTSHYSYSWTISDGSCDSNFWTDDILTNQAELIIIVFFQKGLKRALFIVLFP
jgi:hypothetical protein